LSDKPLENCNVGRRKLGHQSVCSISRRARSYTLGGGQVPI
jgi:hypothetical protein